MLLPYLNDPRHVDDTLFFIMEEDWRLTRHDGFSRAELLEQQRKRGEQIVSLSPDCPPPGSAGQSSREALYHRAALKDDYGRITRELHAAPLPGKTKGKGKKEAKMRHVQAWPLRSTKPRAEEFENTSSFLKQLVRLVTAARRSHRGDLVWMSWNGTVRRTDNPLPQHASSLLALSFQGAQRLKDKYWKSMQRSHFDVSLKWVCENHAKELEASFVMPTIGHYSTHESDILGCTRSSEWERWYVGEGDGPVQLMTWEKEGRTVVSKHILDFDMSEEQPHFDWLTLYRESASPEVEPVATSRQPSPNKIRRGPFDPRHHRTQMEMTQAFDVERMAGEEEAITKRRQRQKRRYTKDSAFRIFTPDALKASWGNLFRLKSQLY